MANDYLLTGYDMTTTTTANNLRPLTDTRIHAPAETGANEQRRTEDSSWQS